MSTIDAQRVWLERIMTSPIIGFVVKDETGTLMIVDGDPELRLALIEWQTQRIRELVRSEATAPPPPVGSLCSVTYCLLTDQAGRQQTTRRSDTSPGEWPMQAAPRPVPITTPLAFPAHDYADLRYPLPVLDPVRAGLILRIGRAGWHTGLPDVEGRPLLQTRRTAALTPVLTPTTMEDEFDRAVREMRVAQKNYFKSRHDPALMVVAKDWERKVDAMVTTRAKPEQPTQPVQGTLFE